MASSGVRRVALLYGPEDLRLETQPLPPLQAGEALIRVGSALTCSTDVKMWRWGRHRALPALPAAFGHEMAGEVVAVAPDVTQVQPGDRVFVANSAPCFACYYCRRGEYSLCTDLQFLFGGFADHLIIPARIVAHNLHPLPEGLSYEAAAMAEPLADAVHGIDRADIRPEDTVAVLGGGALGLMLVRLAALKGVRVIAIDRHAERLAVARAYGATATVDASQEPATAAVQALTEGRGADVVIEAVGTVPAWEQAIELVRPGGTVIFFGGCAAGTQLSVDTYRLHYQELTLRGVFHHAPGYIRTALDLLASGAIDVQPLISGHLPLSGLLDAFQRMIQRQGIKYAIDPARE